MKYHILEDFDKFLLNWEKRIINNKKYNDLLFSEKEKYGRVTTHLIKSNGPVISKNEDIFLDLIEKGVYRLVNILINNYNLITIGSCEGHKHLVKNNNLEDNYRFVRLFFRSRKEAKIYLKVLKYTSKIENKYVNIDINYYPNSLCKDPKTKKTFNIDMCYINFISLYNDTYIYFEEVDKVYNEFCDNLILFRKNI